ncbi:MAG: cyclic nucleotide-binding domain-containing protein [Methylotenera sp.]|nr:cyclic nucleotide-binding domain-containing protein [Methylotenera sp.]
MAIIDQSLFNVLEPIASLSSGRKAELAQICFVERVSKDIDPLRMNMSKTTQALYLLKGDLGVNLVDDKKVILRGGSDVAKHPVNTRHKIKAAIALTDIDILRIDTDLLDIMMTWDQVSGNASLSETMTQADSTPQRSAIDWMNDTGVFSANKLQSGVFSRLPPANIEEMFKRMTSIKVEAGQMIIKQGTEGDYYYLIQKGIVEVSRASDPTQNPVVLAELVAGNAFGEEALVSGNKRNATVVMKTDGELLRLNKEDFIELLKAPLISQISMQEAKTKVAAGAQWVDVRLPSEYKYAHLEGAINLPLVEIRQLAETLNKSKTYILYCQTGRRSSAATFILAQSGFNVVTLEGGVKGSALL